MEANGRLIERVGFASALEVPRLARGLWWQTECLIERFHTCGGLVAGVLSTSSREVFSGVLRVLQAGKQQA